MLNFTTYKLTDELQEALLKEDVMSTSELKDMIAKRIDAADDKTLEVKRRTNREDVKTASSKI